MLFDLRGGGRRRTIQVVYVTLAILMGGGLVLFGIGGDVQGGLFDAFSDEQGTGAAGGQLEGELQQAAQAAQARPRDPQAWANLVRLRVQVAGLGENFDQNTAQFTQTGRGLLGQAAQAWERYRALDPDPVDPQVATLMVQAFTGLGRLDDAVDAQEVVTEADADNPRSYAQLAALAYQAGEDRIADLARKRALELAEGDERKLIRSQLDAVQQQVVAQQQQRQQQQQGGGVPGGGVPGGGVPGGGGAPAPGGGGQPVPQPAP
ncbi:MAG TPA: hypothetical protein VGV40_09335 [Solirubrobacteraceae bacterium]|nr:hypothetical protein [Solirubrobacteraceae bacterium]